MILKNQVHHIKAERDILTESENPWIVTLYSSFQVRFVPRLIRLSSSHTILYYCIYRLFF